MKFFVPVAAALGLAALSPVVRADDVYLSWDGSRPQIGSISEDGLTITPNVRVFDGALGDPDPLTANDPGIMGPPGTFQPGTNTGFEFLQAVRKWNGTAFPNTPSGNSFHVYLGTLSADTPLTDTVTPGLTIPVDANGEWHHHPFWQIDGAATPGIYLVSVDAFNSQTNIRSVPFWFVWNYEVDPDHPVNDVGAAVDWVNANLVPAPGAAMLILPVGMLAARRRR